MGPLSRAAVLAGVALFTAATTASAQEAPPPLAVETNLPAQGAVPRDLALSLDFSRPLVRPAERVAVFIDRTDVTGLFRSTAEGMSYERGLVLLPRGEHEVVVYLVDRSAGSWTEVARESFQTLGRFGFEPGGKADPSLTASWARRLDEGFEPESNAPSELSSNVDLQFRLSTEHVRRNLNVSSQVALVGATQQNKALRYRELEDDAPKVDLSSYLVQASNGPVELSVGHVSAGDQRHLVNRFNARGATLAVKPSERLDLAVAAQGGSSEVGWGNALGFDDGGHRMISGSLGLEALSQPGALRFEVTGLKGSVRPDAGFNQGVVNDAEESRGVAFRVSANLWDRRFRLDAGLARSTFDNPEDPTLSQGVDLVEVREETSDAEYLEASLDALKNVSLGGGRTARLTLGYKHERVDPLYRSLGAYARADQLQDAFDVRADLAGISLQANRAESRNNVDDVPSILTTRTERTQLNVGLPVAQVFKSGSKLLPSIRYRVDRTHQLADELPEDGGFSASHLPDQVSTNQSAQVDWRFGKVTLGYKWNRSHQDNRQEGRENADRIVEKNGVNVRLSPARTLSLNFDLGLEASEQVDKEETDETTRFGVQVTWQAFDRSSLSVRFSDTATEDLLVTRRRANNQVDIQWSSVLPYMSAVQGKYYLRFTRNESESFNATFDQDDLRKAWWVDLGIDFTFF